MVEQWYREIAINDGKDTLIYRPAGGDTIEIYDILVESERGKGHGTTLLKLLIGAEKPKRVVAITRESNKLAHKFYRKNAFVGRLLPSFYPDEDALMFILCASST